MFRWCKSMDQCLFDLYNNIGCVNPWPSGPLTRLMYGWILLSMEQCTNDLHWCIGSISPWTRPRLVIMWFGFYLRLWIQHFWTENFDWCLISKLICWTKSMQKSILKVLWKPRKMAKIVQISKSPKSVKRAAIHRGLLITFMKDNKTHFSHFCYLV